MLLESSLPDPSSCVHALERTVVEVRLCWFGGRAFHEGDAFRVEEPDGSMVICCGGESIESRAAMRRAIGRKEHLVVATECEAQVPAEVTAAGFRLVLRRGVYCFDEQSAAFETAAPRSIGLLAGLFGRRPVSVTVEQIGWRDLESWSTVCWTAFGHAGSLQAAQAEKRSVFQRMGAAGHWYLARVGGYPAGVAMRYQGETASQVLAVGTLPVYRQSGVATAIMQRIVTDWQRKQPGPLFLDADIGSAAERLYQRLGFRRIYQRDLYAPPAGRT